MQFWLTIGKEILNVLRKVYMSLVTSFSSMCMINTQSWSCVFTCDTSSVL